MTPGRRFRRKDDGGRAVINSGGVAGGDRAALAHNGLELAEPFERRIRARVFVLRNGHRTTLGRDLDRDDLVGEIARRQRLGGALLRAQREAVLISARDLVFLGHVLSGLGHGVDAVLRLEQRIDEPPAQRRVVDLGAPLESLLCLSHDQGRARHRFDAPGDGKFRLAAADGARRIADGVEPGRTQPIERHARNGLGQTRQQQRHARHVAAVLAGLIGAAKHDLVQRQPVHLGMALDQRLDRRRGKVVGAHLGERAAISADWRAHAIAKKHVPRVCHVQTRYHRPHMRRAESTDGARQHESRAMIMISQAPIFNIHAELADIRSFGQTPYGERRVIDILGGRVEGPRLKGKILPGADWQIVRPDGVTDLTARYGIETDDGARIFVRSDGLRHGAPEVIAALARGEAVDPSRYYFRTVMRFETAEPTLAWLNRILALATGAREKFSVRLAVYEIL